MAFVGASSSTNKVFMASSIKNHASRCMCGASKAVVIELAKAITKSMFLTGQTVSIDGGYNDLRVS